MKSILSAILLALTLVAAPAALAQDAMHGTSHAAPAAGHGDHAMPSSAVVVGDLEITAAFARATLPNAPVAGGYLTIVNHGTSDDTLIAATSPAAGETQLHEMKMEGDVMKMAELPSGIAIPAGATVTLAPGGLHMMFLQLTGPLVEGATVPVTLTFAQAGDVTVELAIGGIAARSPDGGMTHGHDHAAPAAPAN